MARVRPKTETKDESATKLDGIGLSEQEVVELYRSMVLVRALDERIWTLNRQGKGAYSRLMPGP